MNKFKIWEIETLVEGVLEPKNSVSLSLNFSAEEKKDAKKLERKISENYKNGISKISENFFLVESFNFEKSEKPVFFGEDRTCENLEEKKFFGLKKQQLIFKNKKPVYLIDNHNKALYPFLEISEILEEKINIVHIDAHRDNAIFPEKKVEKVSRKNINYFLEKTQVSDYLDLGGKGNLINKIWNITQSKEFQNFKIPDEKYILSLDIDIFGSEGEMVDLELKIKTILKAWKNSVAVVIATSPGYIKGGVAEKIIKIFVKNLEK